jgi:hypothetical protein
MQNDAPADSEVFASYGSKSVSELFVDYGFIAQNSTQWNYLRIKVPHVWQSRTIQRHASGIVTHQARIDEMARR